MTRPHRLTAHLIHTEAQLRALIGEPAALTCTKITDRLNAATQPGSCASWTTARC